MDRRPVVQWIGIVAICAALICIWAMSRRTPDAIAPLAGVDPIAIERGSVNADSVARESARTAVQASSIEPVERTDRIAGTAAVTDSTGALLAALDGQLVLHAAGSLALEEIRVPVEDGCWEIVSPAVDAYDVVGLLLAHCDVLLPIDLPPISSGPEIHLVGRWPRPVRLHVVDALTELDLDHVTVSTASYRRREMLESGEPRLDRVPLATDVSPIVVESDLRERTYTIAAPDHVSKSITLDHASGLERTIALERAASLLVRVVDVPFWANIDVLLDAAIDGETAAPDPCASTSRRLRFHAHPGPPPHAEDETWTAERLVPALAPGRYSARVLDLEGSPKSKAREVELVAGGQAQAELRYASGMFDPRLEGLLILDPNSSREGIELHLWFQGERDAAVSPDKRIALADMELVESSPRPTYRWVAGACARGTWWATVVPMQFHREIEVDDPVREYVELVVPATVTIDVSVVDSETHQLLPIVAAEWIPNDLIHTRGARRCEVRPKGSDRTVRLDAVPGPARITCRLRDWTFLDAELVVTPGHNELKLVRPIASALHLLLTSESSTVSFPNEWWSGIAVVDELGVARRFPCILRALGDGKSISSALFTGIPDGSYRMTFLAAEGFRPPAPVEFRAVKGEPIELAIPLDRLR